MAVYITGDKHANFADMVDYFSKMDISKKDICIILGDVGLNYDLEKGKMYKEIFQNYPLTLFCIHGNHEERPFNIPTYKEKEWHGGIVYYEPEYPDICFAKDGEIYDILGKKCIVIGGAYSVDKKIRLMRGYKWFPDEQPSEEIKKRVEEVLEANNWKVDYVLTHTVPYDYMPRDLFFDGIDQSEVDYSTELWLQKIHDKLDYEWWFAGHYHCDRVVDNIQIMYHNIEKFYEG